MIASKAFKVYREAGISGASWRFFSYFYKNHLRPILPNAGQIHYAGVLVGRRKIGDWLVPKLYNPPHVSSEPGYEEALIKALNTHVKPSDKIVVVGAGIGVTCVIAARNAGPQGSVTCYEGDAAGCGSLLRVAALNGVSNRIQIYHAVVGKAIGVYGNSIASRVVQPIDLPDCDVLELDCEGAEICILNEMTIRPRVIVVETHGFLGAPTSNVRALLEKIGYSVEDLGHAEPRFAEACIRNDINVLVGCRRVL